MVGEANHDIQIVEERGTTGEADEGNRQDHWWGGSDDIDRSLGNDMSEFLGSTAVPINYQTTTEQARQWCSSPESSECQALQLSFGSRHPGIAQMVYCDGHVEGVQESIEPNVWSNLGTRDGELPSGDGLIRR